MLRACPPITGRIFLFIVTYRPSQFFDLPFLFKSLERSTTYMKHAFSPPSRLIRHLRTSRVCLVPKTPPNTNEVRKMARTHPSRHPQSFHSNALSTIGTSWTLLVLRISPPLRALKQWRHNDDHGCKKASIRDINMTLTIGKPDSHYQHFSQPHTAP
jgi:hypothetical protein